MRVLDRSEMERVTGATHAGTPQVAFDTHRSDSGNHYGWCRGHGNTGQSAGRGKGVQLDGNINKHGIDITQCLKKKLR